MQVSKTRLKGFLSSGNSILKEIMLTKLNEFPTKAIFETAPEHPSIYLTGDAFILLWNYSNSKQRVILSLKNAR